MKTEEQKNEAYDAYSNRTDRISGAIHNTVTATAGTGFDYGEYEPLAVVEVAFTVEPHGNMRSLMVMDLPAAKALRDQLNAILK